MKRTNGELTLAHVRPASDIRAAVAEGRGDLLRGPFGSVARAMADHYEKRLAKAVRPGIRESIRLLRGDPAGALCRESARGYDLLVTGTHGRGRAAAFLLGSTVQELLLSSPIPIVVVRRRRAP